ncbi:DUF317 domain-containing protein [Streptomyces sp. S1]|uniref:DUF317 domain-containing protein n=1 Tax=Streptomyces sp. S1 TaxID=718288 RepID=UPI003D734BF5
MSVPPETVEVDFVTPRHLAGGGDPSWITVPLHRACGWSHGNDPLMPRVLLSSPDQKALLRLAPDPEGQWHWWTLHHAPAPGQPAWYASFGGPTPVELIAAVTDTLTDPDPAANAPTDPYEPLRQIAWTPSVGAPGFVSPDGTAYVQRLDNAEGKPGAWYITATLGQGRPVWQARFGEHTPVHLVAAFTTALTDPHPVLRTAGTRRLPTYDPKLVTRRTTNVLVELVAYALEERVQSLAARHTPAPTTPSPPRRTPPTNGRGR